MPTQKEEPLMIYDEYHLVIEIDEGACTWRVELDLPGRGKGPNRVRMSGNMTSVDDGRHKARAFARFAMTQYVFGE
jgi:hypothetical protein